MKLVRTNVLVMLLVLLMIMRTDAVAQDKVCFVLEPITIANVQNLDIIHTMVLEQAVEIRNMFWSPEGSLLYVWSESNRIWAFSASDFSIPPDILQMESPINGIWSLQGNRLIIAGGGIPSPEIMPDTLSLIENVQFVPFQISAIMPDSNFGVMDAMDAMQILIVDLESNEIIAEYPIPYGPDCNYLCGIWEIAISPDGKWLVYSTVVVETIPQEIINLETGEVNYEPQILLYDLTFSPDGRTLASVGGTPGYTMRRGFALTDIETGKRMADIRSDSDGPTNAAFSPDGSLIAFGSIDPNSPAGYLTIWDTEDVLRRGEDNDEKTAIFSVHAGIRSLARIAFDPSGKMLATVSGQYEGSRSTEIKIWGIPSDETCTDN